MNSLIGKNLAFSLLFLLTAGLLAARPSGRGCGQGPADGCTGVCALQADSTAPLVLSDADKTALQFQLDEERMAGELYLALGEKHAVQPFRNIPRAEARHRGLLEHLANRAGLPTSAATVTGRYETAAVQARYDVLLARGQASLIEALKVGALVEEQDIADLRALAATTDNAELKAAVTALERGSQHHLNAFVRNLEVRGVAYAPQVLNADAFAALSEGGRERAGCSRNRGGRRSWSD